MTLNLTSRSFHVETLRRVEEVAWAAGLYEGEGCASRDSQGRRRLQLRMTMEESVRRFAAVVGLGKVYGPYGPYENRDGYPRSPVWVWVATGREGAETIRLLAPHLSPWCLDRARRIYPEEER